MGLPRPNMTVVKQWIRTSFKGNRQSSPISSTRLGAKLHDDEAQSTSDTVSLYDDSGATSYNFSPVDEETVTFEEEKAPSLSVMLNELLERDTQSRSSLMSDIVTSMSSTKLHGDNSTPTLFATDMSDHDEKAELVKYLLDDNDKRDDEEELRGDINDNLKLFEEWRKRSDARRVYDSVSPRLTRHHSDPVFVYQAKYDDDEIDSDVTPDELRCRQVQYDAVLIDDCTLSSADTTPISNKSSGPHPDWVDPIEQPVVHRKRPLSKRMRWMSALRSHRYLSSLSSVMEEDD